jgi:hypothetical protein
LFVWNGTPILNGNTPSTNDYLDQMKGHVNNLTYMSCLTGQGDKGAFFLQNVANKLGRAEGYDESVMGNGKDWFINRDGRQTDIHRVPEPAALAMLIVGLMPMYSCRHTRILSVGRA